MVVNPVAPRAMIVPGTRIGQRENCARMKIAVPTKMVLLQDNPRNDLILLYFQKLHAEITKKILFTIAVEILELLGYHEIHWQPAIRPHPIKRPPLGKILLTQEFLVDLSNTGFGYHIDDFYSFWDCPTRNHTLIGGL